MAKSVDIQRLEQSMQKVKGYIENKVTGEGGPVKALETKVTTLEGTVGQNSTKIHTIEEKVKNGVQKPDAALDSIAALTGTGVVKMTGADTFAVDKISDTDLKEGDAIAFAKTAFASKNGDVKTTNVTSDTSITLVAADASGKPNVLIKTPTGSADRVVGVSEMTRAIADANSVSHVYLGKFKFFATADTAANAKKLIKNPSSGDTAVIFAAGKVETGKYTTTWAWTAGSEWKDGCWAWVEDILSLTAAGNDYPSGRIILNTKESGATMDVIEDRIAKPDNTSLTYTENGSIGLKKTKNTASYGDTSVLAGADASSIGFGEGKTIKEKIDSMSYVVATEQEVKTMLDRIFGA